MSRKYFQVNFVLKPICKNMGPASQLSDYVCGNYIVNFLFPSLQAQFIGYSLYKFDRILKETIFYLKFQRQG
jgi:hypothetical protein